MQKKFLQVVLLATVFITPAVGIAQPADLSQEATLNRRISLARSLEEETQRTMCAFLRAWGTEIPSSEPNFKILMQNAVAVLSEIKDVLWDPDYDGKKLLRSQRCKQVDRASRELNRLCVTDNAFLTMGSLWTFQDTIARWTLLKVRLGDFGRK